MKETLTIRIDARTGRMLAPEPLTTSSQRIPALTIPAAFHLVHVGARGSWSHC